MGQKPNVNRSNGTKGLRALLIALAMLVVATAGAATAESAGNVQALENELLTLEAAQEIEAVYLSSDNNLDQNIIWEAEGDDFRLADDNMSFEDQQKRDEGGNVVIFVWTNGEQAIVVVVIFQDDGNYEVAHIARMSVEDARERLADFDGRIIVRHFGNSGADPICSHGYLAARWTVNQSAETVIGQFKGVWMNEESVVGGNITGQFANGLFRGMATNLDGEVVGTLQGGYENGLYRGVWEASDSSASGVLAGKYRATDDGQGLMKGKWMQKCDKTVTDPDGETPTIDFTQDQIKCKKMATDVDSTDESTDAEKVRCKVKPMKKPLQIDPSDVKENDSDGDITDPDQAVDQLKKGAQDLLETKIVEMDGGVTIDVSDAAAGGAISSIPMLGLSLLRRRFLL
ncbi:MAG: hypothetical protein HOE69_03225 [Euryarchaeota archaeon]|jgi:uncharacterized cupredoxin-like copper-binding protein|nr:hypothetical protein [Euryarchaeota archaeon]